VPLETGARHSPYEILSLVGACGLGTVYNARDRQLIALS
jgi:hypothetical protein